MTYSFYVVIGGFVVDVSGIHDIYKIFTLTPSAILKLARNDHFIDIPNHAIQDKSKADVLAKGLVCFQVTWLMVQCIARSAYGYPLSLLEIRTSVHVVCALAMYIFWLKVSFSMIAVSNFGRDQSDFSETTRYL